MTKVDSQRKWINRIVGFVGAVALLHAKRTGTPLNMLDSADVLGWVVGNLPWGLIGAGVGGELLWPGNLRNKLIALAVVSVAFVAVIIGNGGGVATMDEGFFTGVFFALVLVAIVSAATRGMAARTKANE